MLSWHQHLYYHNQVPYLFKEGTRIKISKEQKRQINTWAIKHTSLKHERRPFFIYNGSHNINFDGVVNPANNTAFYFFEPLTYYNNNRIGYQDHILRFDKTDNVRSYELDSVAQYICKHRLKDCTVYLPDKYAALHFRKVYDLEFKWYDPYFHAELYRLNLCNRFIPHCYYKNLITKKLWLGNWRYDPVRHYITADLVARKCHIDNNFSWFYNINADEIDNVMWDKVDTETFKNIENLNHIGPLNIDTDVKQTVHYTDFYPPIEQSTKDPVKSYNECFCALVAETRVAQPWVNLSEKILHAIKNRRPFLLYAAPHSLKTLKHFGFKTFGDYWDESYDYIVDTQERIKKINRVAEYINSLDINELREMYDNMKPILLHNIHTLKKIQLKN